MPISIDDFSPGIYTSYRDMAASGAPGELLPGTATGLVGIGVASVENTYGCRADSTKSLVPLPRRVEQDSNRGWNSFGYSTSPDPYAEPKDAAYILDARLDPPYYDTAKSLTIPRTVSRVFGFFVRDGATQATFVVHGVRTYTGGVVDSGGVSHAMTSTSFALQATQIITNVEKPLDKLNFVGLIPAANYAKRSDDTLIGLQPSNMERGMVFIASPAKRGGTMGATNEALLFSAVSATTFAAVTPPFNTWSPYCVYPVGGSPTTIMGDRLRAISTGAFTAVGGAWSTAASRVMDEWPARLNPEGDTATEHLLEPTYVHAMTMHQGRLVMAARMDPGTSTLDLIAYSGWYSPLQSLIADVHPTAYGNYTKDISTYGYYGMFAGDMQFGGVNVLASISGGTLLCITDNNGAVAITGDLDMPTVQALPNVHGADGIGHTGANTPIGYVYGSREGVHVYSGGDTSQDISEQLEGFFWNTYTDQESAFFEGLHGNFTYWHGLVLTPNNFVYDTKAGTWWRLEKPYLTATEATPYKDMPYSCYDKDDVGDLWAFPYKVCSQDSRAAFTYDATVLRSSYSWESSPMFLSDERIENLRDMKIVASGSQMFRITATVTCYNEIIGSGTTGERSVASAQIVFDSPENYETAIPRIFPVLLRQDIPAHLLGDVVVIRLEAMATKLSGETIVEDPDGVAPAIHSVDVSSGTRGRIPRAG